MAMARDDQRRYFVRGREATPNPLADNANLAQELWPRTEVAVRASTAVLRLGRRALILRWMDREHEITGLLLAWRAGDRDALDRLLPLVYEGLRGIAHRQLERERPDHTLGTTALVHEAYLKLVDQTRVQWADRAHFFAVAARAMRRILVDQARRRGALKRGAAPRRVSLTDLPVTIDERADTLLALDEALTELAAVDERLCRVVECRFFGGLTEEETAEALGVTARTVRRDWTKAKGWLQRELR